MDEWHEVKRWISRQHIGELERNTTEFRSKRIKKKLSWERELWQEELALRADEPGRLGRHPASGGLPCGPHRDAEIQGDLRVWACLAAETLPKRSSQVVFGLLCCWKAMNTWVVSSDAGQHHRHHVVGWLDRQQGHLAQHGRHGCRRALWGPCWNPWGGLLRRGLQGLSEGEGEHEGGPGIDAEGAAGAAGQASGAQAKRHTLCHIDHVQYISMMYTICI